MQEPSTKSDNILKKTKNMLRKLGRTFGPGFLTGAADDDPSGIGTYSMAGAKYGMALAWLVPFQLPLMFAIQEMCARIGILTGKGLTANMKRFFPKTIVYAALGILVFANVVNIGADIAIMAAAVKLILGSEQLLWASVLTFIIIMLQIFVPYHSYAKMLLWTAIFLLAYVATALMTTHNWIDIIKQTFTPHFVFSKDFILISTGFVGTTISPYLFFWQTSQEVEELNDQKKPSPRAQDQRTLIRKVRLDTFMGMFFSQLIALFIVITCFSTLHLSGITEINSAYDAALALKPLAGSWAFILFTVGIIGAGFLGIPVLAGSTAYALSEIFDYKASLSCTFSQAPHFYSIIASSTIAGLLMNFININPMKALLYAAVVNGIATVPFIIFIIMLANKKEIMGEHKNSHLSNLVGGVTFGVMLIASVLVVVF